MGVKLMEKSPSIVYLAFQAQSLCVLHLYAASHTAYCFISPVSSKTSPYTRNPILKFWVPAALLKQRRAWTKPDVVWQRWGKACWHPGQKWQLKEIQFCPGGAESCCSSTSGCEVPQKPGAGSSWDPELSSFTWRKPSLASLLSRYFHVR